MARLLHAALVLSIVIASVRGAERADPNHWIRIDEGKTGKQKGSALLFVPDRQAMLLVAPGEKVPFIQTFDLRKNAWGAAAPAIGDSTKVFPYYQAAYDPASKTVFCLSGGPVLYAYSMTDGKWTVHPPAKELEGMSWHAMACDTIGGRLVVIGADKRLDNLGWTRTAVYDIATKKWSTLEVDPAVRSAHNELVAAKEACIDLVGHIRLAWYRDPKGTGTEEETQSLVAQCQALKERKPLAPVAADLDAAIKLLASGRALDALKTVRSVQRSIEEMAEAQYPVPISRRSAPLAFDEKNRVFVLFGGDHEDYLMNDTWILELDKKSWRRASPQKAPSPRAGHALCGLGKTGRVVLYEGYRQSSDDDYSAVPHEPIDPRQLWVYDAGADRWDLLKAWPLPKKEDKWTPAPLGQFEGYAAEHFSPPAMAADDQGRVILAAHACGEWPWRWQRTSETWRLTVDPSAVDSAAQAKLAAAPNQRLYRTGIFVASNGEVPDRPKDTGLDRLPENRWVRLPDPPRNPLHGARQRDWGTCVWDSDRDQVLHWGGGHCVRAASTVAHYSPLSGRIVEGFDADEPYGRNGGGGFDSSLLNRPWVAPHNYNHYAYDPQCKLLVSGRGYLYDPGRMDWLRLEPIRVPYVFEWGHVVVESSPHGAVAWARKPHSDFAGLWLFDRDKGWTDLKPQGELFVPYCDAHGMVYDGRRDRMILGGVNGGYEKTSDGRFLVFDFKTRRLEHVVPGNRELARARNSREMVYLDHADCVLTGETVDRGEEKSRKQFTRIYDCAKNEAFLLDAGDVPSGHSTGWMYDARRKLVYVFTFRGEAYVLKFVPETARLVSKL